MKVYTCQCMPNGLEFACIVVSKNVDQAKIIVKKKVESEGWGVDANLIKLEELDTTIEGARIIDPINEYGK